MEYEPGRNKKDTTEIGAIGIKKEQSREICDLLPSEKPERNKRHALAGN
jgi:hypothetical protein